MKICAVVKLSYRIMYRYSTLCQWPERAHDLFRDALLSSPLAGVASRLMGDSAVRVLNTIVMGSTNQTIIPKVAQIISHRSEMPRVEHLRSKIKSEHRDSDVADTSSFMPKRHMHFVSMGSFCMP